MKVSSGIGFYTVYVAGVLDALLHYQAEVVTTHVEKLGQAPNPPADPSAPRVELMPAPRGSVGLGLGMRF